MKKGEFLSEEETFEVEEETSEVKVPRARKIKTGIVKKVAVCALALTMSVAAVFTMVGCGNTNNPPSDVITPITPTPDPTPVDPPVVTPDDPVKKIPTEKVTAFLDKMGTNYTYEFSARDKHFVYTFDGDKMMAENKNTSETDYHYVEGDKGYDLVYNKETKKWARYDATEYDVNSVIMDNLRTADWTEYDENNNMFTGFVNGKELDFYIDDDGGTLTGEKYYAVITDLGTTSVTLPTADKIYNADEPIVDPNPVEDSKLYTIDAQGNYKFDIAAIQKAFMETTENGNTVIDQVYNNSTIAKDRIVDNVVFINPAKDSFNIAVLMHFDQEKNKYADESTYLSIIKEKNDKWANFVANPENNSIAKFKDFMLSSTKLFTLDSTINQIKIEYSTCDEDYETEHKEEFDKLTSIVCDTVAEKGCKDTGSSSQYHDQITEFKNAKVLFGAKSPKSDTVAGLELGYFNSWSQYYVLDIDGKIEFTQIKVNSSVTNNVKDEKVNVYNKNYRWFFISRVQRVDIDDDNKLLYQEEAKTQNLQAGQVVAYKEKEREN